MTQQWIFTRDDPRGAPPQVELRSDNTGVYVVDEDSAWRGPRLFLEGDGGSQVGGSHGLAVIRPRVPGPQIKPLGVIVRADTQATHDAALSDLARAAGNNTHGRGLVDLIHKRYDGIEVSGRARLVDAQPEVLARRPPGLDCGPYSVRLALDVELPDGVLFASEQTTTVGSGAVTIANGGDVEDVWTKVDITGSPTRVTVVNLDWPGASSRGDPMGFTLYASADAAASDDGTSPATAEAGVDLDGYTVDSGRRIVVDGAGGRVDGLLARRDWHPHFLPLHPGDNALDVTIDGDSNATVTIRRGDPYP